MAARACRVIREVARRRGLIHAMPPQVLRASLERRGAAELTGVGRHLSDHAIHLAISAAAGAGYGVLSARTSRPSFLSAVLYGIGVWIVGWIMFIPLLGVRRISAHTALPQKAVNLVAHAMYGTVLSLLIQGMRADGQNREERSEDKAARIG